MLDEELVANTPCVAGMARAYFWQNLEESTAHNEAARTCEPAIQHEVEGTLSSDFHRYDYVVASKHAPCEMQPLHRHICDGRESPHRSVFCSCRLAESAQCHGARTEKRRKPSYGVKTGARHRGLGSLRKFLRKGFEYSKIVHFGLSTTGRLPDGKA
eukprot:1192590-Prorocentrum_minimum.AAC.2